MIGWWLLVSLAIVRVRHSPLGQPPEPGSSSARADGSEPVIAAPVHPSPDERLADLVERKPGIATSAAAEALGLTPTALASIVERLETSGRVVARDGALQRSGQKPSAPARASTSSQ